MAMGNEMSDGTHPVGPSAGGVLYGQMFNRFGAPEALKDCAVEHGPNGILDPEALVLDFTPLKTHDTQGWPTFIDWPAYDSQLHQAMYYTRSEENTSELQSLMRNSYAVFCLKNKKTPHIQY